MGILPGTPPNASGAGAYTPLDCERTAEWKDGWKAGPAVARIAVPIAGPAAESTIGSIMEPNDGRIET